MSTILSINAKLLSSQINSLSQHKPEGDADWYEGLMNFLSHLEHDLCVHGKVEIETTDAE